uniref:Galectin n=1 Tax=Steinernema glaseri TaxID=37863 RepID=A0A1I7ZIU2_9BILA
MSLPQVFHNPTLPLLKDLNAPFTSGSALVVRGIAYDDPVKTGFMMDLLSNLDVALSLSMQFRPDGNNFIVVTARKSGIYHEGLRKACPIRLNEDFTLNILCKDRIFEIYANSSFITNFDHRVNTADVKKVLLKGALVCREVSISPPGPTASDSFASWGSSNDAPPAYSEKHNPFNARPAPPVPPLPANYEVLLAGKMQSQGNLGNGDQFPYPPPPPLTHPSTQNPPYPMRDTFPVSSAHLSKDFAQHPYQNNHQLGSHHAESVPPLPTDTVHAGFRWPAEVPSGRSSFNTVPPPSTYNPERNPPCPRPPYPADYYPPTGHPCSTSSCSLSSNKCRSSYCPDHHKESQLEKSLQNVVNKTYSVTEKALSSMAKSLTKPAPYCLNLGSAYFVQPQVLSIIATPTASMFSLKNRFEINLKHNSEFVLHINPRFDEKCTVLNSTEYTIWQSEIRLPLPFKSGHSFHMEVVAGDPIRIYVDGRELGLFSLRTSRPINFIEVNNLCVERVVMKCS